MRKTKKQCYFKSNGIQYIDYKNTDILRKFVDPYGRIMSRRRTGTSAKYQRMLSQAIKRARFMGLLPFIQS
jgi:small subunit ribosomal protein S18